MIQIGGRVKLGSRSGTWWTWTASLRTASGKAIAAGMALLAPVLAGPAIAADLDTLTRLLIPAYIAQDLAAMCAAGNPEFLKDGVAGFSSVGAYAEHVKKEVTVHLPERDAVRVRLSAANVARDIATNELRRLERRQGVPSVDPVQDWCEHSARALIGGLVTAHEREHSKFDAVVSNAERRN